MKVREREVVWTMGSDVQRDGMYLLFFYAGYEHENPVAEVFYSDQDGAMSFSAFEPDLPLEVVERLISEARKALPPIRPYDGGPSSPQPS
ncbi:hypothetical protein [Brevundimonas sp.]|uniref:hypothetical protein n=1 Tax=Brevundimonas sp. TaxID=1871086 RepID=UPI003A93BFC1